MRLVNREKVSCLSVKHIGSRFLTLFTLLLQDPQNPGRNRGFAFVEFYNNACADYSRQKMSSASFKLDGNTPTVTWADPKITPDHSAATSQV